MPRLPESTNQMGWKVATTAGVGRSAALLARAPRRCSGRLVQLDNDCVRRRALRVFRRFVIVNVIFYESENK